MYSHEILRFVLDHLCQIIIVSATWLCVLSLSHVLFWVIHPRKDNNGTA
jgi:hypothetical protein